MLFGKQKPNGRTFINGGVSGYYYVTENDTRSRVYVEEDVK